MNPVSLLVYQDFDGTLKTERFTDIKTKSLRLCNRPIFG